MYLYGLRANRHQKPDYKTVAFTARLSLRRSPCVRVSPHVDIENKPTTYYRVILLYASYTTHGRTRKVAQLQICVKSGFG